MIKIPVCEVDPLMKLLPYLSQAVFVFPALLDTMAAHVATPKHVDPMRLALLKDGGKSMHSMHDFDLHSIQ